MICWLLYVVLLSGLPLLSECYSSRETIAPLTLVTPSRFDVMAKYLYARHHALGVHEVWAQDVYREHLAVWNNFVEGIHRPELPFAHCAQQYIAKNSFANFLDSFNTLLATMPANGFNPTLSVVPIDKNGVLMDGGHRTATALLHNIPLICERFHTVQADHITADYFKHRTTFVPTGLRTPYLDAMALEYFYLKENTYLMILFPPSQKHIQAITRIINKHASVVYTKTIPLSNQGAFNLMRLLYKEEEWLGSYADGFGGAQAKKNQCFNSNGGTIEAVCIEASSPETIPLIKKKIRTLVKKENSAAHSIDTHEQSVEIAQTLYNSNGIHWLNHAQVKYTPQFSTFIQEYKQKIATNHIDSEHLAIDASAVLALYGLRDCADLDILHYTDVTSLLSSSIHSHHDSLEYYDKPLTELLFHPDNYLYVNGCKFIALHVIEKFKQKRMEEKDKNDLELIASCITH